MNEKQLDSLFKASVCFALAFLVIYTPVQSAPECQETKVCCNCGITYVVNHKSYVCRLAGNLYNFCNKDCMFRFEDYYKELQTYKPAKADEMIKKYAESR